MKQVLNYFGDKIEGAYRGEEGKEKPADCFVTLDLNNA